jgi:nucleotide-binding universal stress UspA family protein
VTCNGAAFEEHGMSATTTILHPTDFTAHADHAFALAFSLSRASGSRLLVLHVAPIPKLYTKRCHREEMEAALRRRHAPDPAVETGWHLVAGEAVPEILWLAQEIRCALIVMGTQGQTGLARLLMGSVAEQVVRNATCPVVTVKAHPREPPPAAEGPSEEAGPIPAAVPIHTILHPTDLSDRCAEAFRVACSLAKDHAARVIVVHVPEPIATPFGMAPSPPLPEGHRGGMEEWLRRSHQSPLGVRVEFRVEEGDVAPGIVSAARATACDLIVMGTHGRTGLRRLLMGSVAENVLRTAPCPVATVKAPFPEAGSVSRSSDGCGTSGSGTRVR